MSVSIATRGLYGPQGGSSVAQVTGGLFFAGVEVGPVAGVKKGLRLVTQGGGLMFEMFGGAPRLPTVGGAVIVREK